MSAFEAKDQYDKLLAMRTYTCPTPMNKQKGDKKKVAYLTCIVNMLIETHSEGILCNYNPLSLTTVTDTINMQPLRTLARRVDGAFPSTVNPIAVWEIKEYYHTTSFGSRVADGVYEALLDGMEIEELRIGIQKDIRHYLMIDAKFTWWNMGKSYLCRFVDMLHMGYVDEVLVGKEALVRLPAIVKEWASIERERNGRASKWDCNILCYVRNAMVVLKISVDVYIPKLSSACQVFCNSIIVRTEKKIQINLTCP